MFTKKKQENSAGDMEVRGASIPETTVRLWPAAVIVAVEALLVFGGARYTSTLVHNMAVFMLIPLCATLLLMLWWLLASRAPKRARLAGVLLYAAALLVVLFSQRQLVNGALLLMYAVPALPALAVIALALTFPLRWRTRGAIAAIALLLGAAGFAMLRVEGMSGTFLPILSYRWSPAPEVHVSGLPELTGGGAALLPDETTEKDWPGFRGPIRDGRVPGIQFSADWSAPPRELWRQQVGVGWSSFTVIGGYVFTQEQRGDWELVTCYHADTGENVWVNRAKTRHEDSMGSGPRATPTFDQGKLYTLGATGLLQCLDAATGETIWKQELAETLQVKKPTWGFSCSPLIVDDLLIVGTREDKSKSLIAFDRVSGDMAWSRGDASNGYSSPHFAVLSGAPHILMMSDSGLHAFAPQTGDALWEHPWKISTTPRCVQPLIVDADSVMIGTTGALGSRLLRVQHKDGAWDIEEKWTTKRFRPYFNDLVMHQGHAYGFDGDRLACINLATGERHWEGKRYGGQVLLLAAMDMLLILSERGDVALVNATPEGFTEVAAFKALTGKTWNHPVVAQGKLFVRNAEEAACYALPDARYP